MPESGNPLVGIRLKKTSKVDVKGPIMSYIKRVYGDRMANDAAESLDELQELRNQVHGAGELVLANTGRSSVHDVTCPSRGCQPPG